MKAERPPADVNVAMAIRLVGRDMWGCGVETDGYKGTWVCLRVMAGEINIRCYGSLGSE